MTRRLEDERNNATQLKARIEDIWKDDTSAAYELTSVFIHRGSSPSWGHYFFYSRNLPDNPDQWFRYNDSDVTVVSKDEVLADTTGSTANPYMVRLMPTSASNCLDLMLNSLSSRGRGWRRYGQCTDLTRQHFRTVKAELTTHLYLKHQYISYMLHVIQMCHDTKYILRTTRSVVAPTYGCLQISPHLGP